MEIPMFALPGPHSEKGPSNLAFRGSTCGLPSYATNIGRVHQGTMHKTTLCPRASLPMRPFRRYSGNTCLQDETAPGPSSFAKQPTMGKTGVRRQSCETKGFLQSEGVLKVGRFCVPFVCPCVLSLYWFADNLRCCSLHVFVNIARRTVAYNLPAPEVECFFGQW